MVSWPEQYSHGKETGRPSHFLHQTIGYLVCSYLYLRVVKAAGQTARNHPGRIEFWQGT